MTLPVPHFLQEQVVSCIPACVRMILAYIDVNRIEIELSAVLEIERRGTSVLNIELLQETGLDITVWTGEMDADELKQSLDQGVPAIAAVWTAALPYWTENRPHAVVIVGYDEKSVYLNDPKLREAPQSVSWKDFLGAWEEFGRFSAVIKKIMP